MWLLCAVAAAVPAIAAVAAVPAAPFPVIAWMVLMTGRAIVMVIIVAFAFMLMVLVPAAIVRGLVRGGKPRGGIM
jgi:hypothetical protein